MVMLAPYVRAETVRLVADLWCPYNCEPHSDKPGYMVEIARAAFAKHNIEVEYNIVPWARAIEDVGAGKYEAVIGAYYSDAPDLIYPEVPQGQCRNAFFVNDNDTWTYSGLSSLEGRSLGVIGDYAYSHELDPYIEKYASDPARIQSLFGDTATRNNVRKLIMGRVDVIVEDVQVMDYYLGQEDMKDAKDKIKRAGILPDEEDQNGIIFIAFSPIHPEANRYAKILGEETDIMRNNGKLREIMQRYGLEVFEGGVARNAQE